MNPNPENWGYDNVFLEINAASFSCSSREEARLHARNGLTVLAHNWAKHGYRPFPGGFHVDGDYYNLHLRKVEGKNAESRTAPIK